MRKSGFGGGTGRDGGSGERANLEAGTGGAPNFRRGATFGGVRPRVNEGSDRHSTIFASSSTMIKFISNGVFFFSS